MAKTNADKFEFKAETRQLLDILAHSLYSSREIFLRELISNASDALDKLRFESNRNTDYADKDLPLEIRIGFDEKKSILTISDTGIGMSHEEVISNIGTIAHSSSAEFIKQLKENKEEANNIIGKFGVGFYSIFMVAEKVALKSRSYRKEEKPVIWESEGTDEYKLSYLDENLKRGTSIEIKLKEDAKEFASKWKIESVIKQHSNFISFPIYLEKEKVNTTPALWREPKSKITPTEYEDFYKFLSHDSEPPAETLHISVDAPIQYNALLFIPKKNEDFFGFYRDQYGLDLYVRRVLIQHKSKDLIPEYLGFVKGVVDSEDLPLNVSRETLQENAVFSKISSNIITQVLNFLIKKATDEPEKFLEIWKEHGRQFKLGYSDFVNKDKFTQLLRFNSSSSSDQTGFVSIDEYINRVKKDQKEIYFAFGTTRDALISSPQFEIFQRKGIEVLFLLDPIDEFVLTSLGDYKDFKFIQVDQIDLGKIEKFEDVKKDETKAPELSKDDLKHLDSLAQKIKSILGDNVTEVRISKRLDSSPACLVNPENSLSSSMQKFLKLTQKDYAQPKKIFEINPKHHLIINLLEIFKKDSHDTFIERSAWQLFELSLLLEGSLLDPHKLFKRANDMVTEASDLYLKAKANQQ
ncbi:MAG: molecular chaperone HtpG [Ignavibacteriaceae bacterium]|nr:molecular chaperone HtpG [Ignavibacteriaceae bacterium]